MLMRACRKAKKDTNSINNKIDLAEDNLLCYLVILVMF